MGKIKIFNCENLRARGRQTRKIALDDTGAVLIQPLPGSVMVEAGDNQNAFKPGSLLVKSLVDENGERLFKDGEEQAALECLSCSDVNKIIKGINELNGFTAAAGEAEKN